MTHSYTCPLLERGILALHGLDRQNFLQSLISQDIQLCRPQYPLYAGFLNPQGKFLHDMIIFDCGDHFLIDCEGSRVDDLLRRLTTYKLRANISIKNVTDDYTVWASWGEAPTITQDYLLDPRLKELGYRKIASKSDTPSPPYASFSEYDLHRLSLAIPDGSRDMIIDKSNLLEGNFDLLNGINWHKGCYIGQELTARLHYRNLLKKRLYPVVLEGPPVESGADLLFEDEVIGTMRSSFQNRGLALLTIEKANAAVQSKSPLHCKGTALIPSEPFWWND